MPAPVICKICGVRRARRNCPGVQGMICPICCGTEREVSISCPLDCEYLREARMHESKSRHDHEEHAAPTPMPHPDVPLTEDFLATQRFADVLRRVVATGVHSKRRAP